MHNPVYSMNLNAYHATGEYRLQVKYVTLKFVNVKIMESCDHIWNHCKKCIQKSTNMPGFGSLSHEIDVKTSEI